jgi:hypothetical protein
MWYISVQVTSGSKTRSHVDIQVQGNVVPDIYMQIESLFMHVNMSTWMVKL